jgi:hypothetical protein
MGGERVSPRSVRSRQSVCTRCLAQTVCRREVDEARNDGDEGRGVKKR